MPKHEMNLLHFMQKIKIRNQITLRFRRNKRKHKDGSTKQQMESELNQKIADYKEVINALNSFHDSTMSFRRLL